MTIENKIAFYDFKENNLENPRFKDKFVAFVNGKFQDVGDKENALIGKMYDKFGSVPMYVGKITDKKEFVFIATLESVCH